MEGFKIEEILGEFVNEMKRIRPELTEVLDMEYTKMDPTVETTFFTNVYRPLVMEFIKKDDGLFLVPRYFLRNVNFSEFWNELTPKHQNMIWDFLRTGVVASYIGDDWIKTLKDIWSKHTGKETSEIDEILADDSTKSGIEELFEYFKETRIFKLGMEMLETIELEQFGLEELDLTNPVEMLNILKDPSNPFMQRAVGVVGSFIEQKMKKGALKREDMIREIELLKEKFKDSLGKIFTEGIFGEPPREDTQPAAVLLSSHPDARRARMLARLQRKMRDRQAGK